MNRLMKLCAAPIAAFVLFGGSTGRADAIKPWSGASASVHVFDPLYPAYTSPPQTGAVASASDAKTIDLSHLNPNWQSPLLTFSVQVTGSASARATGQADGLLRLDASYNAPNTGTAPIIEANGGLNVAATAGWTGDRVLVQPTGAATAPSTIRLNFSVDFLGGQHPVDAYRGSSSSGITISANGLTASIDGLNTTYRGYFYQYHPGTLAFDSTTVLPWNPYSPANLPYHATFHLDLPLSFKGVSDPFSLTLSGTTAWGLASNYDLASTLKDAKLSLKSITTTDGRLLSDLGDSVTFASGMLAPGVQPSPIPEPSSILIMLVAAVGLTRYFRR